MAYVQFMLVCLFFGSNFILMDRATRWFGPFEVGFGRVVSAAVLMALLWVLVDRKQRARPRDLLTMAGIGLIANAYPYVVQPALIGGGFGHSFFGMTVAFTPLLTILVSIPMLGVKPSGKQIAGVLGGLGFIFLLMYDGNLRGITPAALALACSVPLSYAISNTWMKRSLSEADPTPLAMVMLSVSSLALAPLALSTSSQAALGVPAPEPREGFALAATALLALGAFGTGVCIWAFVRMVQSRGPLFAGMVTYVVPVVAALWGVFDSETITPRQVIAMVGILAMVTLVQSPTKQPALAPPTDPLPAEA